MEFLFAAGKRVNNNHLSWGRQQRLQFLPAHFFFFLSGQ